MRVNGYSGYSGLEDFDNQPGAILSKYNTCPTADDNIIYWLNVTPQRILCTMLSGSSYISFYIGWLDSFATPSQWSYPMLVGYANDNNSLSYTSSTVGSFWGEGTYRSEIMNSNEWVSNLYATPSNQDYEMMERMNFNTDGSVPHFPITLYKRSTTSEAVYGSIEGVRKPAKNQNILTVNDLIIEESTFYLTIQAALNTDELALMELKGDLQNGI
jgi:hypothetical protein